MRRKLLLLAIVGAMVAAPLARSDTGPPPTGDVPAVGALFVSFTPIVNGLLPLSSPPRSLMLIARNHPQTRSSRWPRSLQGYLQRVDFDKLNVLLVVDQNAHWTISIKSIEPTGTALHVTIVAPLPPPIIWPRPGPGPHGPAFALVELPKFPVTAVYGADVAG
jgi:hypothetical protein